MGQQVYATAILYNTLRLSQGRIAAQAGLAPEKLSVDKLFPTLIDHHIKALYIATAASDTLDRQSDERSRLPLSEIKVEHRWLRNHIRDHLLEKRNERRKRRRFCKGRARATSYKKIPGAKKLLQN